ncbi:MAG TPA: hypothetical protein PJ994_11225 [Tepidiformaceae bacterium]|nr:hypothetical protein [Tepidiformaceae bacterium]
MNSTVTIEPVLFEQKGVLRRLLQFYLYDFSEIEPENVRMGEDGEFPYRYLDHYWAPDAGEERHRTSSMWTANLQDSRLSAR